MYTCTCSLLINIFAEVCLIFFCGNNFPNQSPKSIFFSRLGIRNALVILIVIVIINYSYVVVKIHQPSAWLCLGWTAKTPCPP